VALLPCAAKSDVLVFAEGQGDVLTGGRTAMGLLIGAPAVSTASLILTMVDAKSGEVLVFLKLVNSGEFMKDPEKAYGHSLDKQLVKIRIGADAVAATHKQP
jgi:hypothetical protein